MTHALCIDTEVNAGVELAGAVMEAALVSLSRYYLRPLLNVIIFIKSFYVVVCLVGGLKIVLRYRSGQKCSFFDASLCEQHSERPSESQIQKNSNK